MFVFSMFRTKDSVCLVSFRTNAPGLLLCLFPFILLNLCPEKCRDGLVFRLTTLETAACLSSVHTLCFLHTFVYNSSKTVPQY